MNRKPFSFLGLLTCCALSLIGCRSARSANRPVRSGAADAGATSVTAPLAAREASLSLPEDQAQIIREARLGLQMLAERSPKARELLAFYDQHQLPALMDGQDVRAAASVPRNGQRYFFVAANPHTQLNAGESGVYAQFHCYPHAVLTLNQTRGATYMKRGMLLGHELWHAHDCLVENEPPSDQFSDVWLMGELRAYDATRQILDELTQGRWTTVAVEGSWRERQEQIAAHGSRPEASLFGIVTGDVPRFTQLFPTVVQDAGFLSYLGTQINFDANGLNVHRQSQRYGLSQAAEQGHLIEMARRLYEQYAMPAVSNNNPGT